MRTFDTGQERIHESGHRSHHLKVSIKQGSTWYDMTDLEGYDFVESADITDSIDSPTMTAKVTLWQRHGLLNLWLEDEYSKLNLLSGSYDPLVKSQREIKIETATMPEGVDPVSGDWVNVFEGKINGRIEQGGGKLTLNCIDKGGDLMRIFIETQRTYGSSTGVAVETEMQGILTDNSTGVTLYTPTSPSWNVKGWIQQKEPVMTALRRLAQQIGWECKYRWDSGTSAWRLTLYQPDRSKTTPDYTFPSDDNLVYSKKPAVDDTNIRNAVLLIYTDATGQTPTEVTVTDATSITDFGRRYMEIQEDSSSNIDTSTEANLMANAILNDLKDPILNVQIDSSYLYFAETGDLYRFPADDGYNWSSDKDLAVTGYAHKLSSKSARTSLTLQGKVTGAYRNWLDMEARPGMGKTFDKLGPIEAWRTTRHSTRSGIATFHINGDSIRKRGMLLNQEYGHQSRVINGSGWEPDGWSATVGAWGPTDEWYVDSTLSQTGSRSLVYTSDAGAMAEISSEFFPVETGLFYANTLLTRTDNVSGAINIRSYVDWYDSTKTLISAGLAIQYQFAAANTWVRPVLNSLGTNTIAPATARFAKIRIQCTNTTGKKIYIDNYYVAELPDSQKGYNNSSQSIPGTGTWTTVDLDTTSWNPYGNLDTTNDVISAAFGGSYAINARWKITGMGVGDEARLRITRSSTATGSFSTVCEINGVATTSGEVSLSCAHLVHPEDTSRFFQMDVWQNRGSAYALPATTHDFQAIQTEQLF